jgi:tetratricopeptide (TPR) repeat protein
MIKVCCLLISIFFTVNSFAQNSSSTSQNTQSVESNLPLSEVESQKPTADDIFIDAERNERSGNLNEALTLFGKAAFAFNSDKKLAKYASALLRMSNIHLMLNRYTEAEQVALNVALKVYARMGSKVGQMATYSQLAKVYFAANKLPQSMWFYTQQGILANLINNKASYIDSVLGIAAIKIKKKQFYLAAKDLSRAEILAKNSKIIQFEQQFKNTRLAISERK